MPPKDGRGSPSHKRDGSTMVSGILKMPEILALWDSDGTVHG